MGQHLGVNQCFEYASARDLIETEMRQRGRQRQCQCRLLEVVGLDSDDEILNLATCRGHCVVLQEIVKFVRRGEQAMYRVYGMLDTRIGWGLHLRVNGTIGLRLRP